MENVSPNQSFLLINKQKKNLCQIQKDRHVPTTYNANTINIENDIDLLSNIIENKKLYDYYFDILFYITGYEIKLFKNYPEDEIILKSIFAKSFQIAKKGKDQDQDQTFPEFDDTDQNKSKEDSNKKLIISSIEYLLNHEEICFQNAVKVIIMLIYLSKDKYDIKEVFQFQSIEDRENFLFIELIALSDIFFTNKSINRRLFSQYGNTSLTPNIDFQGKLHQLFVSYNYDSERLLIKSNNQDFNFEIPFNFFNGTINNIEQTIDFIDHKRCTFAFEKKERGLCSGLIINFFYDEIFVRKLYCKELFCFSERYQENYQQRINYFKQIVKIRKEPISKKEYSRLANICKQIPLYSDYVDLQYENMVTQYVYHFNAHVELFGYYLFKNLEICPEFTVYRSEFDSKTYIVMKSLSNCYHFCRDIDPTTLCNTTISGLCHSTIKLHYLRVIHQVFFLSDFHESNVALKFEGDNVEDINIIDLWPTFCPLEMNMISDYESLKKTMNGQKCQVAGDENIVSDALYTKLNSLDEQVLFGDPVVYDIMLTKEWRFKMLTYHTYDEIFRKIIDNFSKKHIKYDDRYSLCCFAFQSIFNDTCTEIKQKQFLPDDFKSKDEYISYVLGVIGLFLYKYVMYVNNDSLHPNFSLFESHIYRQESYYPINDYWKRFSICDSEGISYINVNWKLYVHTYIESGIEFSFLYSNSIKNNIKSPYLYSKDALEANSRLVHIWFDSPVAFDISINYFKFKYPQIKIHRIFLE